MIDTVSNLVELVRIDDKTSAHIAKKYAQEWLTQYLWPARRIPNNGGKFMEPESQLLLEGCWIKNIPTTSDHDELDRFVWAVPNDGNWCASQVAMKRGGIEVLES